jgi:hypothetical protein
MSEYLKRKRGKRPERVHKRKTMRMRHPDRIGRKRSKREQRIKTQNATSGTVRRARRGRS